MQRSASAVWKGGLQDGKGTVSTGAGALSNVPYTFKMRFADEKGTNPEELIAAAHAACYSMALSLFMANEGLTPESIDTMVNGNLTAALYCVTVALPFMRAQQDGQIIHTASMAGRFIGGVSGPIYVAAKHGIVAMSHGLNMEECVNGIRSCVICPGEVATPILEKRPNPVSAEERARMVQPEDCGDLIRYVACLPKHVCLNEVLITPTWNRGYVASLRRKL